MEGYFLIASRDPFTARDTDDFFALAGSLAARSQPVTLLLVQNGVLAARPTAAAEPLTRLARSGVTVLVDAMALRERGIAEDRLAPGLRAADLDCVIDALAGGARVLWS